MNYLKQIHEFSIRRKLFPLRATSIAMYYVMLEHFNQARFPPAMPIPTALLAGELGVTEATIRNCRRELCQKGYIELLSGGRIAEYRLVELLYQNTNEYLGFQPLRKSGTMPNPAPTERRGGNV